jgi:3-hydroxyisobutyrate dehydrogenase-like beta-hydroxyacid dehydrogenase
MSDSSVELVAFLGLGAMGGPMCANLASKSPVPVLAYDLDSNAVEAAVSSGSVAANDLADISRADIVFICVPGEEQI